MVALFTRAWIEMMKNPLFENGRLVALFTRAWIEIESKGKLNSCYGVALFTRAWIEIIYFDSVTDFDGCRPLHEGVD